MFAKIKEWFLKITSAIAGRVGYAIAKTVHFFTPSWNAVAEGRATFKDVCMLIGSFFAFATYLAILAFLSHTLTYLVGTALVFVFSVFGPVGMIFGALLAYALVVFTLVYTNNQSIRCAELILSLEKACPGILDAYDVTNYAAA